MAWEVVQINCDAIEDWPSFHQEFGDAFGFAEDYEFTIEAWIDVMCGLDDTDNRRTAVYCDPGEVITIELLNVKAFSVRCPEEFAVFIDAAGYVNWRRLELGQPPIISFAFFGDMTYTV